MSKMGIDLQRVFGWRRRPSDDGEELDMSLASAQMGLERKRQRWLLFLIEKEEACADRAKEEREPDGEEPGDVDPEWIHPVW
jgi:hypothetical protein